MRKTSHRVCLQATVLLALIVSRTVMAWASDQAANAPASDWFANVISQHGFGVGLLAVFLGGLLLNFTPCVYPMIPVTIAFFTSQATLPTSRPSIALGRTVMLACCYVLGISSSYAILGAVAASTGVLFGAWLQQPVVLIGIAIVIVGLSLSMFGLYDLRPPQWLLRRTGQASAGLGGAFLMGVAIGVVAAPCIGPFVLGLLLLVSKLGHPAAGFLMFFVLGLGMGLPYVVLGVMASRVSRLPKSGVWLVWSKHVLGVVLLGLALYFLRPLLSTTVLRVAVVGLLVSAGVYLGWLERSKGRGLMFVWVKRVVGTGLIIAALALGWPKPDAESLVAWTPYSEAALEQAQREHRPIIVDVYADWCLPCVELDHVTFRHPDVVRALAGVATLRVDVTRDVSDDGQALLERYHIFGAPTILFFDRTGRERKEFRSVGFMKPDEFLETLSHIQ